VGMAAHQLALSSVGRELVGEHADRNAGGTIDAARPVGDRLAAAETDAAQRFVEFIGIAAAKLSEHFPLDLARTVRTGRRLGHQKLGKAKWCAHPPGLQLLPTPL